MVAWPLYRAGLIARLIARTSAASLALDSSALADCLVQSSGVAVNDQCLQEFQQLCVDGGSDGR